MIVRDIMVTKPVTVEPDDTLAHAADLLRQYQFHHLPVARKVYLPDAQEAGYKARKAILICEGLLTSSDIDLAAAMLQQPLADGTSQHGWQERRVVEFMHRAVIRVTPMTSVAAAAQLLVERGLNALPVVEYGQEELDNAAILVGLITRSDLLVALSRVVGTCEPGMQLDIALPIGNTAPLARALLIAADLHVKISSILATPLSDGILRVATVRLGTINPTPLLIRLQEEGIQYSFGSSLAEENPMVGGDAHV